MNRDDVGRKASGYTLEKFPPFGTNDPMKMDIRMAFVAGAEEGYRLAIQKLRDRQACDSDGIRHAAGHLADWLEKEIK